MKELGVAMHLGELGVSEDILGGIADGTIIIEGSYKVLNHDEEFYFYSFLFLKKSCSESMN